MKSYDAGYIRCWACNGNGLDPAAYFTFKPCRAEEVKS
jgi:hypothetical protein